LILQEILSSESQEQIVTGSVIGSYDYFGSSVAISGNYASVGASNINNGQCAVYIYKLDIDGLWKEY